MLLNEYNCQEGLDDITTCLKWLRETPQCNGLVATIGYGIGGNLSYLAGLWLDVEASVCYDFYENNIFKENDTFLRRPMLIHLSEEVYNSLNKKNKLDYIDNIKNISLKLYKNSKINFFRLGDENFDEFLTLSANKLTEKHITKSFNHPYST